MRRLHWLLVGALCLLPLTAWAQFPGVGWAVNPAITYTTWNPADVSTNLTLSDGNLTATNNSGSNGLVRSIANATGKVYSEFTLGAAVASVRLGFGNASIAVTANLGGSANGVAYIASSGVVAINGATITTIQTTPAGSIARIAVDFGAKLIWVSTDGGSWNNNGSADPATGVGGATLATLNPGPYYAAVSIGIIGTHVTANFGATAFTYAVPAGFTAGLY